MKSHRIGWHTCRPDTRAAYGSAHRRIRKRLLADNPLCECCGERPSAIADHKVPVCMGGPTEAGNYQALCQPCSLTKTGSEGAMVRWARRRARKVQADA